MNPVEARAEVLAVLECVDYIVEFGDPGAGSILSPAPSALCRVIAPDVLVKGSQYAGCEIVGAESAGRVHLAAMREGYSTTRTIQAAQRVATLPPGPGNALCRQQAEC